MYYYRTAAAAADDDDIIILSKVTRAPASLACHSSNGIVGYRIKDGNWAKNTASIANTYEHYDKTVVGKHHADTC